MKRVVERLSGLYMVDALCDADVQPFYQSLGFTSAVGASVRRYQHQSGRAEGRPA